MEPLVRVLNLSVRYGDKLALENVSFEVPPGRLVAVVGPNGAGKTSLFRALFGEGGEASGEVRLCGLDPFDPRDRSRLWSEARWVSEDVLLYDELTVREFLAFMAHAFGVPRGEVQRSALRIAQDLGLAVQLDRLVGNLSQGDRRKVHIAAGFFSGEGGPRVLVLDEPTNGLDPPARVGLAGVLRDYVQPGGARSDRSVLIASHNLAELSSLADHVIMLDAGKVKASGSRDELLARMGGGLRYELVLFDDHAAELAELLARDCGLVCQVLGPRTLTFEDADAALVRRVLRLLADAGDRFQVRELKEQMTPLEGIFHWLLGEGPGA